MIYLISEGLTREAGQEMLNGFVQPVAKEKLRKHCGASLSLSVQLF